MSSANIRIQKDYCLNPICQSVHQHSKRERSHYDKSLVQPHLHLELLLLQNICPLKNSTSPHPTHSSPTVSLNFRFSFYTYYGIEVFPAVCFTLNFWGEAHTEWVSCLSCQRNGHKTQTTDFTTTFNVFIIIFRYLFLFRLVSNYRFNHI